MKQKLLFGLLCAMCVQGALFAQDVYLQRKEARTFKENNLYGLKDERGNVLFAPKYEAIGDYFYDGYCYYRSNGKYGILDANGKEVTPPIYDSKLNLEEEGIIAGKDGKYGLINRDGSIKMAFEYNDIASFSYGRAIVKKKDYYGVINTSGQVLLAPNKYYEMKAFHKGYAVVKKGGKYGMIDKDGNLVIPTQYYEMGRDVTYGLVPACRREMKCGFVSVKDGEAKIPMKYQGVGPFRNGLSAAQYNFDWGYITPDGQTKIAFEYREAENFDENLAMGKIKNQSYNNHGITVEKQEMDRAGELASDAYEYEKKGDGARAFQNYNAAARLGLPLAAYKMGVIYEKGELGQEKSPEMSIKWYAYAAETLQFSKSCLRLGDIYSFGLAGQQKNLSKAAKYYEMGAYLRNIQCIVAIGKMYLVGDGVENNPAKGLEYLWDAIYSGNADAQYSLAYCYYKGIPGFMEIDLAQAVKWGRLSASAGFENAIKSLPKMEEAYRKSLKK